MATPKRFRKSNTQKVIFGVCGGLAEYIGTDAVVVRLVWILITLITGFVPGIVVYLIAALIAPEQ